MMPFSESESMSKEASGRDVHACVEGAKSKFGRLYFFDLSRCSRCQLSEESLHFLSYVEFIFRSLFMQKFVTTLHAGRKVGGIRGRSWQACACRWKHVNPGRP